MLSAGFNTRVPILVALASYIDGAKNMAQLYTLMSVIEALAHVVGSPLIEMIWAAAVGMGSQWLVLPFVALAVCNPRLSCLSSSNVKQGFFFLAVIASLYLPDKSNIDHSDTNSDPEREALIQTSDNNEPLTHNYPHRM